MSVLNLSVLYIYMCARQVATTVAATSCNDDRTVYPPHAHTHHVVASKDTSRLKITVIYQGIDL